MAPYKEVFKFLTILSLWWIFETRVAFLHYTASFILVTAIVFCQSNLFWDCANNFVNIFRVHHDFDANNLHNFEWFWMESLHKNIQLMQEFLKAPFLVPHFPYYTWLIFLTMLSVILLSMLMILFSILSVISGIWSVATTWIASESDLQDTVDLGKKWLVDFNSGKTQLVSFDWSNNNGSIDVKMDGSVLEETSSFKMLGLTFSSKLDW